MWPSRKKIQDKKNNLSKPCIHVKAQSKTAYFSHENRLVLGLIFTVLLIQCLTIALVWNLNWSLLSICTLVFGLFYPLIWLSWRCYRFWRDTIMQLTTYTQVLKEGEYNLSFKTSHPNNLLHELQREISSLAQSHYKKKKQDQSLESLLNHILDSWPIPVCLFDEDHKLSYRNMAMKDIIKQPMLMGTTAGDLGFSLLDGNFKHAQFNQQWQCQSISYSYQAKQCYIFSALNISQQLQQQQSITQQNLIRVLTHELRNSLTPMASMADTLLSNDHFNEQQVRLVLERIQIRSDRLLCFIEQYSQLSQLPSPECTWFDFNELVIEAQSMTSGECKVNFQGNSRCYADMNQMSQVLINIFKNSREACEESLCCINITTHYINNKQVIEILDNGRGFANLKNALTPFYTTKKSGSGIGLSLCAEIIANHLGELSVGNNQSGGAKIIIEIPTDNKINLS
jgi:nitrogen fixation/metabolism regulation signal transduction histidine kinase